MPFTVILLLRYCKSSPAPLMFKTLTQHSEKLPIDSLACPFCYDSSTCFLICFLLFNYVPFICFSISFSSCAALLFIHSLMHSMLTHAQSCTVLHSSAQSCTVLHSLLTNAQPTQTQLRYTVYKDSMDSSILQLVFNRRFLLYS